MFLSLRYNNIKFTQFRFARWHKHYSKKQTEKQRGYVYESHVRVSRL